MLCGCASPHLASGRASANRKTTENAKPRKSEDAISFGEGLALSARRCSYTGGGLRREKPRWLHTIQVARKSSKRDRLWFGAAPRIIPETDKTWRPASIKF